MDEQEIFPSIYFDPKTKQKDIHKLVQQGKKNHSLSILLMCHFELSYFLKMFSLPKSLQMVNVQVKDLFAELADGVTIVKLVEVLSGKKITGVQSEPKNSVGLLSNINRALETLREDGMKGLTVSAQRESKKKKHLF